MVGYLVTANDPYRNLAQAKMPVVLGMSESNLRLDTNPRYLSESLNTCLILPMHRFVSLVILDPALGDLRSGRGFRFKC